MTTVTFGLLNLNEVTNDFRGVFVLLIGLVGIGAIVAAFGGRIKTAGMMLVGVIIALSIMWIQGNPNAMDSSLGQFVSNLFGGG